MTEQTFVHPDSGSRGPLNWDQDPDFTRICDWYLGGKDNYQWDREAGSRISMMFQPMQHHVRTAMAFHGWASRKLAWQGAEQFLAIGAGIPTPWDLHYEVRRENPDARVLYVERDVYVAAHRRALGWDDDKTKTALGDLAETEALIAEVREQELLDFGAPVVVSLSSGVLEQIEDAATVVRTLSAALPPGSALLISHFVTDPDEQLAKKVAAEFQLCRIDFHPRSIHEVRKILAGYELLEPGLAAPEEWITDIPKLSETHCRTAIGHLNP